MKLFSTIMGITSACIVYASSGSQEFSRFIFTDGQELIGYIEDTTDVSYVILLLDSSRIVAEVSSVDTVIHYAEGYKNSEGDVGYRDPNRTRYLYSPSGFMLHRGEVTVSQKEVMFTAVGYGINEHINLQLGSMIPFLFFEAANGIGGIKIGYSPYEQVHCAAGYQLWCADFENESACVSVPFLTTTYGREDMHATLNVSLPFTTEGFYMGDLGFISLSGLYRLNPQFAVVSENVFLLFREESNTSIMINTLALRIMGAKLAVDAGLAFSKDWDIPIPWLDFSYHFSL
ncbi:MAG: hypothetical protein OCD01_05390 [Fibrobacterales bacterium]